MCYNCGEEGHEAVDCVKETNSELGGKFGKLVRKARQGGCFNCGEESHFARDCPHEKRQK